MGTRGTIHIYVNGQLKIRQYNQWDSYPTGQFAGICEYFRENKEGLRSLAYRLINSRLSTELETRITIEKKKFVRPKGFSETQETQLRTLINRDIGSDILYIMSGMPLPEGGIVVPDWMYVHDETFPEGEDPVKVRLPREEGNYIIELECEIDDRDRISSRKYLKDGKEVRFRISGEFWGIERSYDWGYVPTDKEIKEWEKEAISAYEEKDSA